MDDWVATDSGVLTHALLATLTASGSKPAFSELLAAASDLAATANPPGSDRYWRTRRRALRTAISLSASMYVREAWLPEPWAIEAVERSLGAARADLVWRHPDGRVIVDEVKTGQTIGDDAEDQLDRLWAGAHAEYGSDLVALRLVAVRAMSRSLTITAGGRVDGIASGAAA